MHAAELEPGGGTRKPTTAGSICIIVRPEITVWLSPRPGSTGAPELREDLISCPVSASRPLSTAHMNIGTEFEGNPLPLKFTHAVHAACPA
jgi:hypothetical protein